MKRRDFLTTVGALGAATLAGRNLIAFAPALRQAQDAPSRLSRDGGITFGYAAITWGGKDRQAIEDVASLGFKGIQLRSNLIAEFGDKPAALRELLEKHKLTMVAFSSGTFGLDPAVEKEEIEKHTRHAKFVRDIGGLYLQLIDERPKGRAITAADYKRSGRLMTEIGKRTADLGIPIGYHNHMNNLGERPEEVRAVLDAADPRYVRLLLDVAHYQQGGGDPVAAVKEYKDRLLFLHIKDLESPVPAGATTDTTRPYRFVELGRGKVNLEGVFAALEEVKFKGWAIIELDRVPDSARTPKEAAEICRKYIEGLGYTI